MEDIASKIVSNSTDSAVSSLVSELMNASTSLHKLHLNVKGTGSYAAHKALNEIYDSIKGLADSLAESYQGATERLLVFNSSTPKQLNSVMSSIAYLNSIKNSITSLQKSLPYSEIVNLLDEIKSDINSAKYKLIFLQ